MRANLKLTQRAALFVAAGILTGGVTAVVELPQSAHATGAPCQNGGTYSVFAGGSGRVVGQGDSQVFKNTVNDALAAAGVSQRDAAELGDLDRDNDADPGAYPAVDPSNWGIFSSMNGYYNSVDLGIRELQYHLNSRVNSCPREAIVLGGYSQGADVVARTIQSLSGPVRDHIAYVALYGDPNFDSCGDAWSVRGNSSGCTVGFLGTRSSPYMPDSLRGRVGSWCDWNDGICVSRVACQGLFPCAHGSVYRDAWIQISAPEIAEAARRKVNELNPPGAGSKLASTLNQDGRLALFYVGGGSAIYYQFQTVPNGSWGGEQKIAAYAKSIAAVTSADGRIELFYTGSDDSVVHRWQPYANCGCWSPEENFGTRVKAITAARNGAGKIALASVDFNNHISYRQQSSPNSWNGTAWQAFPGVASDISMATSADGRNEMFYVGGSSGVGPLIHRWELSPGGEWSPEEGFPANIRKVAATRNQDGRLEVFAMGENSHLFTKWQTQPNVWYSAWAQLTGRARYLAAGRNQDGRLELFHVGWNNRLYHQWQGGQGCCWTGENVMYGSAAP